jgi:hypothetical protein
MFHDGWGLQVAFSTVPLFLQYLEMNDGLRGDNAVDDPNLPSTRFLAVRTILHDNPEAAVSLLTSICADFPECADYWFTLAGQLRRLGDNDGSARAAIRAFTSNWAFGMPPNGTLKLLQNARANSVVSKDPLIVRSSELSMAFGGTKENPVYEVLRDCIAGYLASNDPLPGILLNQNYGYMMLMETTAFQDRYGFKVDQWLQAHSQLCSIHLGDDRRTIS